MPSGGKRGAGERVLESKHVIGLFLLMLVFSGVFFSLGYVMGRNQYDGQVRAANGGMNSKPDTFVMDKPDVAPKKAASAPPAADGEDPAISKSSDTPWVYDKSSSPAPAPAHLELQLGLVGYYFQQVSDDFGAPPSLDGFRSRVAGVGPFDWAARESVALAGRAVLPGLAYQLGNLLASRNVHFQAAVAQSWFGGRLAPVMGWTVVFCAVFIAVVASLGREAHGADLSGAEST